METAVIDPTEKPDAEVIHHLIAALDRDASSLGKDDVSKCVRDSVGALRTAIDSGAGTVAATLLTLETTVDRLHMSHMRPFFKQTLRALRTALQLDVQYTRRASTIERPRWENANGSFNRGRG